MVQIVSAEEVKQGHVRMDPDKGLIVKHHKPGHLPSYEVLRFFSFPCAILAEAKRYADPDAIVTAIGPNDAMLTVRDRFRPSKATFQLTVNVQATTPGKPAAHDVRALISTDLPDLDAATTLLGQMIGPDALFRPVNRDQSLTVDAVPQSPSGIAADSQLLHDGDFSYSQLEPTDELTATTKP